MSLGALWNNGYFLSYPVIIVFSLTEIQGSDWLLPEKKGCR